ncbi:hypothetical protein [Shimia sp.]|uniref:hypothetical protein n=1 Tax=Shimia sp. TaxID=1954381 RepID=UPI003BA85B94
MALPTWAVLRSLGRQGVRDQVARHCGIAARIAERLNQAEGVRVLNDVVLNQIIVSFGPVGADAKTRRAATQSVINRIAAQGTIFVGGARWHDEWVMRISVICAATQVDGRIRD